MDIKPSNLILTPSKEVKVIDFGFAAYFGQCNNYQGTLPYVAPEIFSPVKPDCKADVYAIGCLIYELATSELLFPQKMKGELLKAKYRHELPQMDGLPRLFTKIISQATIPDPDMRLQSVSEILELITPRSRFKKRRDIFTNSNA